jgi:hypothetical protein
MDLCARTLLCTHYTWTGSNNGTCTLRRGAVSKANASLSDDATLYCGLVSGGVDWSVTQNTANNCDWDPKKNINITSVVNVEDSAACQALCLSTLSKTPSCTHFTYSAKTCWLKTGIVDKSTVIQTKVADMVCGYVSTGKKPDMTNKTHQKLNLIDGFFLLLGVVWYNNWVILTIWFSYTGRFFLCRRNGMLNIFCNLKIYWLCYVICQISKLVTSFFCRL